MKRLLVACLLLSACATPRMAPPPPVGEAEMRATIAALSADDMQGRMSGTPGEAKSAAYIAERFRSAGLAGAPGGFLQPFQIDRAPKDLPASTLKLPPGQRYFLEQLNKRTRLTAYNVVGKLPGRAPDGRAVLVMAHYDHLGTCMPEGAADRICNGAVDNGSGVAAMIAVAERIGGMKLDRDVWFVATGAEEWGLLGAKAFAERPPLPLGSIVAGFNLDTIAVAPADMPVAIVAANGSPLEGLVRDSARAMGRAFDGDQEAASFLERQDGWALSQRGVPMIMAGGSFSDMRKLQAFLAAAYHSAEDELRADTLLAGAVDDANLHVELVRRAASRRFRPSFAKAPGAARN